MEKNHKNTSMELRLCELEKMMVKVLEESVEVHYHANSMSVNNTHISVSGNSSVGNLAGRDQFNYSGSTLTIANGHNSTAMNSGRDGNNLTNHVSCEALSPDQRLLIKMLNIQDVTGEICRQMIEKLSEKNINLDREL